MDKVAAVTQLQCDATSWPEAFVIVSMFVVAIVLFYICINDFD